MEKGLFGLCGSLWIFVDLCGSLWFFVDLCGSLWIFVDLCGSLWLTCFQPSDQHENQATYHVRPLRRRHGVRIVIRAPHLAFLRPIHRASHCCSDGTLGPQQARWYALRLACCVDCALRRLPLHSWLVLRCVSRRWTRPR